MPSKVKPTKGMFLPATRHIIAQEDASKKTIFVREIFSDTDTFHVEEKYLWAPIENSFYRHCLRFDTAGNLIIHQRYPDRQKANPADLDEDHNYQITMEEMKNKTKPDPLSWLFTGELAYLTHPAIKDYIIKISNNIVGKKYRQYRSLTSKSIKNLIDKNHPELGYYHVEAIKEGDPVYRIGPYESRTKHVRACHLGDMHYVTSIFSDTTVFDPAKKHIWKAIETLIESGDLHFNASGNLMIYQPHPDPKHKKLSPDHHYIVKKKALKESSFSWLFFGKFACLQRKAARDILAAIGDEIENKRYALYNSVTSSAYTRRSQTETVNADVFAAAQQAMLFSTTKTAAPITAAPIVVAPVVSVAPVTPVTPIASIPITETQRVLFYNAFLLKMLNDSLINAMMTCQHLENQQQQLQHAIQQEEERNKQDHIENRQDLDFIKQCDALIAQLKTEMREENTRIWENIQRMNASRTQSSLLTKMIKELYDTPVPVLPHKRRRIEGEKPESILHADNVSAGNVSTVARTSLHANRFSLWSSLSQPMHPAVETWAERLNHSANPSSSNAYVPRPDCQIKPLSRKL